jgi:hypothetical protein
LVCGSGPGGKCDVLHGVIAELRNRGVEDLFISTMAVRAWLYVNTQLKLLLEYCMPDLENRE